MAQLPNEPSSPETMTSRASIISATEVTDDPITTLSANLTPDKNVATQSLTGGKPVTRIYSKSPHYLPLACLALCLNPPLGIPAFLCAMLSRRYRLTGREHQSARFSQWAMWLSLVAIASAIVIIIFTVVYVQVITPNIIRTIEGFSGGEDHETSLDADEGFPHLENTTVTSSLPP